MMSLLTIGECARRSQVNVDTVRYYERRGLLPTPARRPSGYRQYDASDVARIRTIREAQRLGFTLGEILTLLPALTRPHPPCSTLVRRAERKIDELTRKIRELEEAKAALEGLVDQCTRDRGQGRKCKLISKLPGADIGTDEPHRA